MTTNQKKNSDDFVYIAGDFLDPVLPKEYYYLNKYFKTETERMFLKYYLMFNPSRTENFDHRSFSRHTGIVCTKRWKNYLIERVNIIISESDKSRQDFNLDKLCEIQSGSAYYDKEKIKELKE